MTNLTKMRNWLMTFPLWDKSWTLYTDYTDAVPGNGGLYPLGAEELSRWEDITGTVFARCRYRFYLYRVADQGSQDGNAQWLLEFQEWVRQQSATGSAPRFGDVPTAERLRAEKGKLSDGNQTGTGKYVVSLIAEFIKQYNEMEE